MKKCLLVFSLLFLFISVIDAQVVSNFAGTPQTNGGTTSPTDKMSARFEKPYGIDFDSKGNLWIADFGAHVIYMVNAADDKVYIRAGGFGQASFKNAASTFARLSRPKGIAVGLNDEIYIAGFDNQVIRKLSPFTNVGNSQNLTVYAGDYDSTNPNQLTPISGYKDGAYDQALFNNPSDVAVDDQGNVYVADAGNHCIRKIAAGTRNVTTVAGLGGISGDADGAATTMARFNNPTGIHVEGEVIYVVDRGNQKIKKVMGGQVTTVIAPGGPMWTPDDVLVYSNMTFWTDQHRVIRDSATTIAVYAGSNTLNDFGYMNGQGLNARFYDVKAIIRKGKDLYVSDMNNYVVRKISTIDCSGYKPTITNNGYILIASDGVSYQWYKNGNSITGATMKQHDAETTGSGDYTVVVENSDGCIAESDPFQVVISSLPDQHMKTMMTLYPNPGNGILNMKFSSQGIEDINIIISDVLGKTVYSEKIAVDQNTEHNINISNYENGMYFISIQSEAGKETMTYIKK